MKNRTCSKFHTSKIITLGLVFLLPLFLTACTLADVPFVGQYFGGKDGEGIPALGDAELTIWGLWENPDVLSAVSRPFIEKNTGVKINYDDRSVIKPLVDYKERVYTRATDPTGPDVMRVHASWVPSLASSLVPMPTSMMSVDDFRSSFYPVASENLIVNNKIYGMPSYYDGLVLVYNKKHFEEIGQTEPPTAWEEFRRLALKLTIRGDDNSLVRAGAAIGSSANIDFFSDIIGMLFSQAKISVPKDLDTKAAQDALGFYTNFVKEDKVWSDAMPEASVAFSQEKVSMIFVTTWNLLDIVTMHPEMSIGVAPVPQALADDPASWASFWVDVVPLSSKKPEAAWAYIKYMAESQQQLATYSESSKYRVFGAPFSLVSLAGELSSNPYISPVLQTASFAHTNELAGRAGNRRQVDVVQENITKMLEKTNPISVQEALVNIKAELSR